MSRYFGDGFNLVGYFKSRSRVKLKHILNQLCINDFSISTAGYDEALYSILFQLLMRVCQIPVKMEAHAEITMAAFHAHAAMLPRDLDVKQVSVNTGNNMTHSLFCL